MHFIFRRAYIWSPRVHRRLHDIRILYGPIMYHFFLESRSYVLLLLTARRLCGAHIVFQLPRDYATINSTGANHRPHGEYRVHTFICSNGKKMSIRWMTSAGFPICDEYAKWDCACLSSNNHTRFVPLCNMQNTIQTRALTIGRIYQQTIRARYGR